MAEAIITKEMLEVSETWVVAISSELNEWCSHSNSCISYEEEDIDIQRSQGDWQGYDCNEDYKVSLQIIHILCF